LTWIILILVVAAEGLAAPALARWLGRDGLALSLRLALGMTAIASVAALFVFGFGVDPERDAYLLWGLGCVAVTVLGAVAATRSSKLPARELLVAIALCLELGLILAVAFSTRHGGLNPGSAVIRALLIAPPVMLLSGYFGISLGYLIGRRTGGDFRFGYEGMVARRFLLAKSSAVLSTVTTISVIGVALGVWMVIVSLAVLAGFERDLETKIIGANAHVLVQRKDGRPFVLDAALVRALKETPGVAAFNPIIESEVAVASRSNYIGALLFGIDPELAPAVLTVLEPLAVKGAARARGGASAQGSVSSGTSMDGSTTSGPASGQAGGRVTEASAGQPSAAARELGSLAPLVDEMKKPVPAASTAVEAPSGSPDARRAPVPEFAPPSPLAKVVIGAEMAKGLNVTVGERIRLISPTLEVMTPLGPAPKSIAFEVAGIFASRMYEFDARYAFISLPAARRFLELDADTLVGVQLAVDDPDRADLVAADFASRLGADFEALDWKLRNQTLFSALKLERVVAFVVLVFIILVASFAIANTLTMSVIEKKKEIAILKTMGARDGGIMKLFLLQGLIVGAVGIGIGLVLAVGTVVLLERVGFSIPGDVYYIDSLPVRLEWPDVVLVVLAAVIIIWDFAVFPALRGSRLSPVEGLRDG